MRKCSLSSEICRTKTSEMDEESWSGVPVTWPVYDCGLMDEFDLIRLDYLHLQEVFA